MQENHDWAVTTNRNAYGGSRDADQLRFETSPERYAHLIVSKAQQEANGWPCCKRPVLRWAAPDACVVCEVLGA
jgi:hypothetical protein